MFSGLPHPYVNHLDTFPSNISFTSLSGNMLQVFLNISNISSSLSENDFIKLYLNILYSPIIFGNIRCILSFNNPFSVSIIGCSFSITQHSLYLSSSHLIYLSIWLRINLIKDITVS